MREWQLILVSMVQRDMGKKLGIPTEFHVYSGVEHEFGPGIGTALKAGFLKR